MALKNLRTKTASDGADDIKRKAVYLLKTMADTLNSMKATLDQYGKANVTAVLTQEERTELMSFYTDAKAFIAAHDNALPVADI